MKAIHTLLTSVLMALALASCDVHEFPDTPEDPNPMPKCVLRLHFDNADFGYLTTVGTGTRTNPERTDRDLRVIVRLYPIESSEPMPARLQTRGGIEIFASTFADDGTHPDVDVPIRIEAGEYRVVAWADHVKKGDDSDLYYTVQDFLEVRLPGSGERDYVHRGNDPYREAWRGTTSITVGSDGRIALSSRADEVLTTIDVNMERPLARYHFISNDFRKFIETEAGKPDLAGKGTAQTPSPDDYRVVIRYTGYMNCAFNLLTDKPIDSATGVIYEGTIQQIDDDRAELAFDHLFVNHTETSVQVALDLYRRSDGQRLSSTGAINVPLQRGRYTLIEGALPTTDAGASTGINPDFFGEFNIEIH